MGEPFKVFTTVNRCGRRLFFETASKAITCGFTEKDIGVLDVDRTKRSFVALLNALESEYEERSKGRGHDAGASAVGSVEASARRGVSVGDDHAAEEQGQRGPGREGVSDVRARSRSSGYLPPYQRF